MKKNKIIVAITLSMALIGGTPLLASAQVSGYCAPSVGTAIAEDFLKKQQQNQTTVDNITDKNQSILDSSNSAFSCSDAWALPSISASFQSAMDILKKAGDAAISKACNTAREEISSAVSKVSQQASIDTSNIPGLSDLGLGTIASVSSGTSSTGGITVNGQSSTWNSLSSLMN